MEPPIYQDPERLLADARWVQHVARSLVRDRETAEDVSQEAWRVALARQAVVAAPTRSWMGRVVRHLAMKRRRGDARRLRRETAAWEERTGASAGDLVLRAEAQEVVARELVLLDEPLRSTLLFRFFDGLSTREIAERTGVEADTVRARTRRALAQLRARLEDKVEGGVSALLPLLSPVHRAHPCASLVTTQIAAMALGMKATVGTLAVLLLGAAFWFGARGGHSSAANDGWVAASEEVSEGAFEPTPTETPQIHGRMPGLGPMPGPRSAIDLESEPAELTGRVTFVYPDGREVHDGDGRLELRVSVDGGSSTKTSTRIRSGAWSIARPTASTIQVVAAEFREADHWRPARIDSELATAFALPSHQAFRLQLRPELTIHAVDAVTGRELADVEVIRAGHFYGEAPYVLDDRRVAHRLIAGDSPLCVPLVHADFAGDTLLWVGAHHRGWAQLGVTLESDQDVRVALDPAGDVEVLLSGGPALANMVLDLEHQEVNAALDWSRRVAKLDRFLLTGVPRGPYQFKVGVLPWHASSELMLPLGREHGRVEAGSRTTVKLGIAHLDARPLASLDGRLVVPTDWGIGEFELRLAPIDVGPTYVEAARTWTRGELVRVDHESWSFSLPQTPVGRYVLELVGHPVVTHREILTLRQDSDPLKFSVPSPVDLQVKVIDAVTASPLAIDWLVHGAGRLPKVSTGRVFQATLGADADQGSVALRVPAGPLVISLQTKDGRTIKWPVEASGPAQVVVEVP